MFYIILIKIYNIIYFLYFRIINKNFILVHKKIKLKQIDVINKIILKNNILENQMNSNENSFTDFLNIYSDYYIFFLDLIVIIIILIFLYYFFNNGSNGAKLDYNNLSLNDLEAVIKVKFQIFLENNSSSLNDIQLALLNKKLDELLYNLNLGLYKGSSLDYISIQINEIFKNIV